MIKAVLFDLDGTLVNSLEDLAEATNYSLAKHGYPTRPAEKFRVYAGNGNTVMMERALPEEARKPAVIEAVKRDFFAYYGSHPAVHSKAYEGVVELLAALNAEHIGCAVITNKADSMTKTVVPAVFGSSDAFRVVLGQTDAYPLKPQPHMAFAAMNEMEVNPDECLFVGDSAVDMITAHSAGCVPVGALWGFRGKEELKEGGARFFAERPMEILDILHAINQC